MAYVSNRIKVGDPSGYKNLPIEEIMDLNRFKIDEFDKDTYLVKITDSGVQKVIIFCGTDNCGAWEEDEISLSNFNFETLSWKINIHLKILVPECLTLFTEPTGGF